MSKAIHMLSILWLLHSRSTMTAEDIASELEVSVRSVYRYIDGLCMSGVPIVAEPGHHGGYRLDYNFRAFPLFFDGLELQSLFNAAEFAFRAGYPHSEPLKSGLEKLKYRVGSNQAKQIGHFGTSFGVLSPRRGGPVEAWLATVDGAITNFVTLNILYHKAQADEPEWRRVDPYGIIYDSGIWYMAAFCHKRSALRDFRIDRIRDLSLTPEHFERPADFKVTEYFANPELAERLQTGPFTEVRIEGTVYAIDSISDHWYLKHCMIDRTRTEIRLHLNEMSMVEVPPILLSYGTSVAIITPELMKEALRTLAYDLVAHYSSDSELP